MKKTGVKVTKGDFETLKRLAESGWMPGDRMIVFSVGEGIRKDQNTVDAKLTCHQLALDYGLPEIQGYYGIDNDGEFITN